jgi:hypothetical protein
MTTPTMAPDIGAIEGRQRQTRPSGDDHVIASPVASRSARLSATSTTSVPLPSAANPSPRHSCRVARRKVLYE